MSKETAKELLEITKIKPHKIRTGDTRDIDYIEVAEEYRKFFIKTDEAIFSWSMIDDFWELETKSQFRSGVDKIKSSVFFSKAMESFRNKYKLEYPYIFDTDSDLNPNTTGIIKEYPEDMINLPSNYVESGKYILKEKADKDFYPLYFGIYKALFFTENNQLQLDELTHIVSTEDMTFSPKYDLPFDETNIFDEIKNHEKYFNIEINSLNRKLSVIKLNIFLEPIIETFLEKRIEYSKIEQSENGSGVLAIVYNGKEFPLEDANEYVKIRDIIGFNTTENFFNDASFFFNQTEIIPNNLNAVIDISLDLSKDADMINDLNQWLRENILLSFYPSESEDAKFYSFCLKLQNSPLLETNKFFENIYRKEINELNINFTKKMESVNNSAE